MTNKELITELASNVNDLQSHTKNTSDPVPVLAVETEDKEFGIDICLKGANDLRSKLPLDENGYLRIPVAHHPHPKEFLIYGILDEIEKAGTSIMRGMELLKDVPKDKVDRVTRNIYQAVVDEQMVWVRKLTDILSDLILFNKTNDPKYFHHYLLIKSLEDLKRKAEDFKDYYSGHNRNLQYQIDIVKTEIKRLESTFNIADCWYLPEKKGGKSSGVEGRFATAKKRISEAILSANASEKIVLGFSYDGSYGLSSGSLHFSIGGNIPEVDENLSKKALNSIGLYATSILIRLKKLMGDKSKKGIVAQLSRLERTNKYPQQLARKHTNPGIKVGDFVMVHSDLAEVIKINRSKYGYRSFTVRYLSNPPTPGISTDTFPGRLLKHLYSRPKITKQVLTNIKETDPSYRPSSTQLSDIVRKSMVDWWEHLGLKYRMTGRPDLAAKQIEEYLAKPIEQRRGLITQDLPPAD